MGLTNTQKRLIEAVSNNNIQLAKKYAATCCEEDTTAKNRQFCSKYRTLLTSAGNNLLELPYNLKNILYVEDVSNSFKEGRYFLSEREKAVFENIIRMKQVNSRLMEMGIPYINSTLLYGESGTGKTTFGRYIAYRTGLPFCYLDFTNLIDSYMGNTSKNISKAFDYAIANPCVFMLDEIDCISIRRSESHNNGSASGEMARITITLMQEFDKLTNDLIVIGATNRKDRIDEALLRRFALKHEVTVLSEEEKYKMVIEYLNDIGIDFPEEDINLLIAQNRNQSSLLDALIRMVSEKICNDI